MQIASEAMAEKVRMGRFSNRILATSATVYRPKLRSGSADQKQSEAEPHHRTHQIDEPVIAKAPDETGDPEERSRGHEVTSNRKPVLKPADPATGRIELVRGVGSFRCPVSDHQRQRDDREKKSDGDRATTHSRVSLRIFSRSRVNRRS